jgi:hypothetical protein
LKERVLRVSSTNAMASNTSVSRQRYDRPTPFSMMPRAISTNQRAGTTCEMICSGVGMLSIGKMNPERSMVGSIVPIIAPIIATRCDDVRAEISIPSDKVTRMNRNPSANSNRRLPRMGT